MRDPVIDQWLQSRNELERLTELEHRAADAWFDSLSPEQQEVCAELLLSSEGISHLRQRLYRKRLEADKKRERSR